MKELPYFRFTPSEWQNGKISLEDYELQGFFIQVCSYYWISDCSITLAMLSKRYKYDKALIEQCLNLGIFEHNSETDFITISFLNEQFDTLSEARKKRQNAGYKGGIKKGENYSNAIAKPKQSHDYKDKEKDKDNIKREEKISPPEIKKIETQQPIGGKNFLNPIDDIEKCMLENIYAQEAIAMKNKLPNVEAVQTWIKEYILTQKAEGFTKKSLTDAQSHFSRWLTIQLKNKEEQTPIINGKTVFKA